MGLVLLSVKLVFVASNKDFSMRNGADINTLGFPRSKSKVVILKLYRNVVIAYFSVNPNITCNFLSLYC